MTIYNHFEFKHVDDGDIHTSSFSADFVDTVINNFAKFLAGCGYHADSIYTCMEDLAKEYFQSCQNNKVITDELDVDELVVELENRNLL